jgi:hypothetical protein
MVGIAASAAEWKSQSLEWGSSVRSSTHPSDPR